MKQITVYLGWYRFVNFDYVQSYSEECLDISSKVSSWTNSITIAYDVLLDVYLWIIHRLGDPGDHMATVLVAIKFF